MHSLAGTQSDELGAVALGAEGGEGGSTCGAAAGVLLVEVSRRVHAWCGGCLLLAGTCGHAKGARS
ncbi:hypothetical protein [Streptomyces auratus]|uniref:Uncharacterized protein n=1 Tax=Streptomyces auratus AGR0001 TaxID=1160718 RepID=A0A8B1NV18_9ACTN|nr:hypothetical protein [Streptomyces auratus]QTZ94886.1 hypothetical protein SU9_028405 [Streptomyces auratus AGR0001]